MKHEVRICFDGSEILGGPEAVLGPARCGPDIASVEDVPILKQLVVWVTLEKEDTRLDVLLRLLRRQGCDWLELHHDRYTEAELEGARLLVMQSNGECEIDGGIEWGTTYDLTGACPACGTGGRQTSAVFLNGEQLSKLDGHRAGATYHWHHLVDERLAAELESLGPSGLTFHSVYAVAPDKRQVKRRWKQMCAENTLPRMSPKSSGFVRDRACMACNRNGYFTNTSHEPPRFAYRASDLSGAHEVTASWENVGYAILNPDLRDSLLSKPWMLVSPKVRRIFMDAGVTSFDWTPIRVEDNERGSKGDRGGV